MGQKITEHPQVDYWVKLTREADKKGATLPHRDSADKKELSQFGDMQRARYRSSFSVVLPPGMMARTDPADVPNDDAPGADEDEGEDGDDGDTESAERD